MMIKPTMAETIFPWATLVFSGLPAEVRRPKPPAMSMKKRIKPAMGKM